jgi:Asp-tRNA(Asn)/Glu-tRNA(Gln) amidotransferase A subunit family amidase
MTIYDLKSLKLPKLSGKTLDLFAGALRNPILHSLILPSLLENGGIPKLRQLKLSEPPTLYPLNGNGYNGRSMTVSELYDWVDESGTSTPYSTVSDYAKAYRSGITTPLEVAGKVLDAINASDRLEPPLKAFVVIDRENVLSQARAATKRFREGKALSIFDGVPVAIKDEMDMLPYPTKVGTSIIGKSPAISDSTVAARLRSAGALLIGKASMREIGISPNGSNVHNGRTCNPWDLQRDTGGSSSGPSAVVASGLCPVAIGADGGGSIRIPAALCGVVGLKPTFGRVSERGAAPLCWSVAHLGPIGATVEDVALSYAITAGPDPEEPLTQHQPPVSIKDWNNPSLAGVRLGVFWDWFRHADSEIVSINQQLVDKLVAAGASIVEIQIPELDAMRIAHVVTILSEMALCMKPYNPDSKDFASSTRLNLKLGQSMTSYDYIQAQRMRTRAIDIFKNIFKDVDAIITPTTGLPAPIVPTTAIMGDWSDLSTDTEMMRFVYPANLTGNPAITFPAGYTKTGLPVNMHATGRHWEENLLLRLAYAAEQVMERRKPGVFYSFLS